MIVTIDFSKATSKPRRPRGSSCEFYSRENPQCARESSQEGPLNPIGVTVSRHTNEYGGTELVNVFRGPFGEIYTEDDI